MADPLTGFREAINNRDIRVMRWPGAEVCPVKAGDRFELRSCVIVFDPPTKKLVKGKWEWHATWVRVEADKPQLLRRVPSGLPQRSDEAADMSQTIRANRIRLLTHMAWGVGPADFLTFPTLPGTYAALRRFAEGEGRPGRATACRPPREKEEG